MAWRAAAILGVLALAHAAAAQFTKQGSKLVGSVAVGPAHQGYSVALSADGSTAIVTGYGDDAFAGAVMVMRSGLRCCVIGPHPPSSNVALPPERPILSGLQLHGATRR